MLNDNENNEDLYEKVNGFVSKYNFADEIIKQFQETLVDYINYSKNVFQSLYNKGAFSFYNYFTLYC